MSYALNKVEDLAERLNLIGSCPTELLYSCLVSASYQLLTYLRSDSFDKTVGHKDIFLVEQHTLLKEGRYLTLTLSSGFVDESKTPIAIVFSDTKENFDNQTAIPTNSFFVNKEKGLVIIDLHKINNEYFAIYGNSLSITEHSLIQVTYDFGLDIKVQPYGKLYQDVPDWLHELSLLRAREIYYVTNPLLNEKGKPLNADYSSSNMQPILEKHVRIHPLEIKPII